MNHIPEINDFLPCKTPKAWITRALKHKDLMLIDHANCEKKAATAAIQLINRYYGRAELLHKMSRVAREELLHFDKVLKLMKKHKVPYKPLSASRYASSLRKHVRLEEPHCLVDFLIIGAYIEARSCERFEAISPYLDEDISAFYDSLYAAEKRHFQDYLRLAHLYSKEPIDDRIQYFADIERELIESPDEEFRFHSGV
jgi:tRNA 2-(methylsulfanyl)-N6-isopentenyladenosine37 hydroxylase